MSQWSHASQAAEAALGAGASEAVILSALLHDIGHLQYQHSEKMGRYGVRGHERLGAYYLNTLGFSSVVAELVGLHVDAKRYRVAKDASYAGMLSPASKRDQAVDKRQAAMTIQARQRAAKRKKRSRAAIRKPKSKLAAGRDGYFNRPRGRAPKDE